MTLLPLPKTNKIFLTSISALVILLFLSTYASATTYYVNFKDGDDLLAGTSEATAWQHAPGDINAEDNANRALDPGDTVLFKGGVYYRGEIVMTNSGTADDSITYKGDGWGADKAILDGSELITDWTQCQTLEECENHPNYDKIWYAYAPADTEALSSNLFQDDERVYLSQAPNMPDPFFWDDWSKFLTADSVTSGSVTDSDLISLGGETLVENGYVHIYIQDGNTMASRKITGYDASAPGGPTISFSSLSESPSNRYSVVNVLSQGVFNRQGEFVFNVAADPGQGGKHKVYLWPLNDANLETSDVSIPELETLFDVNAGYITIEGFKIQKYVSRIFYKRVSPYTPNLIFRNNEVTKIKSILDIIDIRGGADHFVFENNYLHDIISKRGIYLNDCYNGTIRNNTLQRISASTLLIAGSTRTKIVDNKFLDISRVHGNAMAIYTYNSNILVAGNIVIDSKRFTVQNSDNIYYLNNILNAKDSTTSVLAHWGGTGSPKVYLLNNVIIGGTTGSALSGDFEIVKNNILNHAAFSNVPIYTNNIFVSYRDGNPGPTDIVERDLTKIFVDPTNDDYHLKPGSPAIDNGADVTDILNQIQEIFPEYDLFKDIEGNPRPSGGAVGSPSGPYSNKVQTKIDMQAMEIYSFIIFWILIGAAASTGLMLAILTGRWAGRKYKRTLL